MGRLEKIVVLTVLFLVAVVLGVALTPTGGSALREKQGGPLADAGGAPNPVDSAPAPAPIGALSAETHTNPASSPAESKSADPAKPAVAPKQDDAVAATPPANPPAAAKAPEKFILTTDGLKPSGAADMMFYTWSQGDTFATVAQRYYGSKEKLTRLQKANEGRTEASLRVGELLWIPVAETSPAIADSGKIYVVKSGDMLSGISQQFYGTSKKWQKILDANRDTLASPEKLKPGMKLRIPE